MMTEQLNDGDNQTGKRWKGKQRETDEYRAEGKDCLRNAIETQAGSFGMFPIGMPHPARRMNLVKRTQSQSCDIWTSNGAIFVTWVLPNCLSYKFC